MSVLCSVLASTVKVAGEVTVDELRNTLCVGGDDLEVTKTICITVFACIAIVGIFIVSAIKSNDRSKIALAENMREKEKEERQVEEKKASEKLAHDTAWRLVNLYFDLIKSEKKYDPAAIDEARKFAFDGHDYLKRMLKDKQEVDFSN